MIRVEKYHKSKTKELSEFLTIHAPRHPEIWDCKMINWQKGNKFLAFNGNKIVGFIMQINQKFTKGYNIGWTTTIILNRNNKIIQALAGDALLKEVEKLTPHAGAVGVVDYIVEPYKKRGYDVRHDCSNLYSRFLNPSKGLKFLGYNKMLSPVLMLLNSLFRVKKSDENVVKYQFEQIEKFKDTCITWMSRLNIYGVYSIRNKEYLNWKLSQPNKKYIAIMNRLSSEYMICRVAQHPVKDFIALKICDIVATDKTDFIAYAIKMAKALRVDAIISLDSQLDEDVYKKCGMYMKKKYPIAIKGIKEKMHITFFDSDLDNLW